MWILSILVSGALTALTVGQWFEALLTSVSQYGLVSQWRPAPDPAATVVLVGDMMLGRDVEAKAIQRGWEYPFAGALASTSESVAAVIANFEASVPREHQPTEAFEMKFSVANDAIDALASSSVTHVSLANNHSLDFGWDDFHYTVDMLAASGLVPFGAPTAATTTASSSTMITAGNRVVLVLGLEALSSALQWDSVSEILAATQSDIQVAYIHFGEEYELVHSQEQQSIARRLIDEGFEVVIGHHPHVVQDIERYRGGLIFYSLGNFIFDQYFDQNVQAGLWLEMTVLEDELHFGLKPVSSAETLIQPRFMDSEEAMQFLSALAARSDERLRDDIARGQLTLPLASQ